MQQLQREQRTHTIPAQPPQLREPIAIPQQPPEHIPAPVEVVNLTQVEEQDNGPTNTNEPQVEEQANGPANTNKPQFEEQANGPANIEAQAETQPNPAPATSRHGRPTCKNPRLFGDEWVNYQNSKKPQQKMHSGVLNKQYLASLHWDKNPGAIKSADLKAMLALMESNTDVDENTIKWMHPMILAAKANSADNPP